VGVVNQQLTQPHRYSVITFRVSRRRRKMYCGHARLCVCLSAYHHAKFHLDPSNSLTTIHKRQRQTGQRSDSIGRTVLQTVVQKLF